MKKIISLSVLFALAPIFTTIGAEKETTDKEDKVDSTVMFRQMPVEAKEISSSSDIFDLPDIALPSSEDSSADVVGITLPIPMINLGISKSVLPLTNSQPKTTSATTTSLVPSQQSTIPQMNLIDASKFDIGGIFLGMDAKEVQETIKTNGFQIKDITRSIPSFLEWRFKDICKKEGVLVYEQTKECINALARKSQQLYISKIVLEKPELKEKITVFFTSSLASNLAYKIVYDISGDYSLGTSAEPIFKKRERRKAFWVRVFSKYGWPSDLSEMIWTEGFDKASLKAYMNMSTIAARLVLEDLSITDADTYEMFKTNQELPSSTEFSF